MHLMQARLGYHGVASISVTHIGIGGAQIPQPGIEASVASEACYHDVKVALHQ